MKKINTITLRYRKAVQQAKTKLRKMSRNSRKSKEIELAWLINSVERYGTDFPNAEHYVVEYVEQIEKLV